MGTASVTEHQGKILELLKSSGGQMRLRDIERALNVARFGTVLWDEIYTGLLEAGAIYETGSGSKGHPKMVYMTMENNNGNQESAA